VTAAAQHGTGLGGDGEVGQLGESRLSSRGAVVATIRRPKLSVEVLAGFLRWGDVQVLGCRVSAEGLADRRGGATQDELATLAREHLGPVHKQAEPPPVEEAHIPEIDDDSVKAAISSQTGQHFLHGGDGVTVEAAADGYDDLAEFPGDGDMTGGVVTRVHGQSRPMRSGSAGSAGRAGGRRLAGPTASTAWSALVRGWPTPQMSAAAPLRPNRPHRGVGQSRTPSRANAHPGRDGQIDEHTLDARIGPVGEQTANTVREFASAVTGLAI
jgi:hypothetical protein